MDEQSEKKIIQEIFHLLYLFQKENGMLLNPQPKDLSHRDLMILDAILRMHPDGSPVKMSDISAYFQITPAAVSQGIRSFERKGLVERIRPCHDRRSVYVQVSEKAKEQMRQSAAAMRKNLQAFIQLLGEEDAQALIRILEKTLAFYRERHAKHPSKEEGTTLC